MLLFDFFESLFVLLLNPLLLHSLELLHSSESNRIGRIFDLVPVKLFFLALFKSLGPLFSLILLCKRHDPFRGIFTLTVKSWDHSLFLSEGLYLDVPYLKQMIQTLRVTLECLFVPLIARFDILDE